MSMSYSPLLNLRVRQVPDSCQRSSRTRDLASRPDLVGAHLGAWLRYHLQVPQCETAVLRLVAALRRADEVHGEDAQLTVVAEDLDSRTTPGC